MWRSARLGRTQHRSRPPCAWRAASRGGQAESDNNDQGGHDVQGSLWAVTVSDAEVFYDVEQAPAARPLGSDPSLPATSSLGDEESLTTPWVPVLAQHSSRLLPRPCLGRLEPGEPARTHVGVPFALALGHVHRRETPIGEAGEVGAGRPVGPRLVGQEARLRIREVDGPPDDSPVEADPSPNDGG